MLLNCGIASFLSVLATFTATIVALNWTQFNVSVLTETDARHFYFAANGQTAPNGKSPRVITTTLHLNFFMVCSLPGAYWKAEAAKDFRERCLTCHKVESCRAPFASRQSTSPPDSCVACHMPKQQLENISHRSATDHLILRDPSENLQASDQVFPAPSEELVYDSRPLGSEEAKPDLRSRALAYPQVAGLRQKALQCSKTSCAGASGRR